MPKIIKLSDMMKAIEADHSLPQNQRNYAGVILEDIESYPGESFARRARFMPNTLSRALGFQSTVSYRRVKAQALELAKKYNIEPVEGSIDKEKP